MDLTFLADVLNSQSGSAALAVAALGGVCALVASFLTAPGPESGPVYKAVYAVINWLGCNVGKAANADDARARDKKAA